MYAEIKAAVDAGKALLDLSSAAKGVVDQVKLASATSDLLAKLLAAQSAAAELAETIATLQQENSRLVDAERKAEDFRAKVKKYALREIADGVFAYVANDFVGEIQSAVKLCQRCFHDAKIAPLQQEPAPGRTMHLTCARCATRVHIIHYKIP